MMNARLSPLEKNVSALMGSSDEEFWQSEGPITTAVCKGRVIVVPFASSSRCSILYCSSLQFS
jgi:hypothetical protein